MSDFEYVNNDDFHEDAELIEDIDNDNNIQVKINKQTHALRRLEQIREEIELNRILNDNFDDFLDA